MGSSRIIENKWISIHFHYSFGGTEGVGSSGIIENNIDFFTFSLFLCGAASVGSSRNIEKTQISLHFHYFFSGAESVGNSGIIENM